MPSTYQGLTDPQYLSDLHRIHESEVYGIILFKVAEKVALGASRKAKWRALQDLEVQTLERFKTFVGDTHQSQQKVTGWQLKGKIEGLVLGLLPWSISMRLLAKGTEDFQKVFLRLKEQGDENHKKFFSYIYAHEKAIEAFALGELEKSNNSLKAVSALLD